MSRHPAVEQCVVVAREEAPGDHRLLAFFVPKGSGPADGELRDWLREKLPDYMVPGRFLSLSSLPLTPNGKIDRKALPAATTLAQSTGATFIPPAGDLEATLAVLWREVLGREEVGACDNFFDLGGHSLLVVRLHRRLRELAPRPLTLTDLYRYPTIRGLADFLSSRNDGDGLQKSADRGSRRRAMLAAARGTR